jgi:hypothetical protein
MNEEKLSQQILNWIPTGRRKKGDQKQDGRKAYLEPWKNVVYEKETNRTNFVGILVSKDVAIRHRMTTYIQIKQM